MGFTEEHISFSNSDENLNSVTKTFVTEFDTSDLINVKTSGSTGTPKYYNVEKDRFIYSAQRTCAFFGLKSGDRAFLCISPEFIGGKMMIIRSIITKMHLTLGRINAFPFESKEHFDFAAFVPLQIIRIIETNIDYLKSIRNIIIGGGVLDHATEKILVDSKINAYVTFGMTETLSHIALRKVGEEHYSVLDGIEISIDSENRLQILDPKVVGPDMLQTNDLIEITSANTFKWIGRHDNIINSGGIKLIPESIEKKLNQTIDKPFFISKEKDSELGEKVILIVQGKEQETFLNFDHLDRFEKPKNIYFLEKFVYTETEKINRNQTLDLLNLER